MGNGNSTETKESRRSKFRHKIQNFRSRRRLHRPGSGSVSGLVSQRSVSAEDFAGIALLTLISNPNFVFNPRKKLNFPIRRQGIPKTAKSFCVRSSMSLSRPRQTLSSNWDVSGYSIDSVAQSPSRLPSFEELDTTNMLLRQRIVFLGSQVDDMTADLVISQLLLLDAEDSERDITLFNKCALSTAPSSSENRTEEVKEKNQDLEQENDLWKNIKDFAGSVANGALKWLRDNL